MKIHITLLQSVSDIVKGFIQNSKAFPVPYDLGVDAWSTKEKMILWCFSSENELRKFSRAEILHINTMTIYSDQIALIRNTNMKQN